MRSSIPVYVQQFRICDDIEFCSFSRYDVEKENFMEQIIFHPRLQTYVSAILNVKVAHFNFSHFL